MNMLCRFFSLSITIVVCSLTTASAQNLPNTTRLLRFPTTNDRDIVFCYAGQLYTVGKDGGTARRLTSGPGYTSFSRFSPDGTQIAFTSEYDGNREVYVMPAEGGVPKRLTTSATLGRDDVSDRMGPNNIVMAWENTKPLVVFRSRMRSFDDFVGSLFAVVWTQNCRNNCRCRAADSFRFRRTIRRWRSTASSANSAHGNIIAAAWRMTFGFTILKPAPRKT
jgi:Periplasmic component of the Tol biopolymer transport system